MAVTGKGRCKKVSGSIVQSTPERGHSQGCWELLKTHFLLLSPPRVWFKVGTGSPEFSSQTSPATTSVQIIWLWSPRPAPYAFLSPGFATAAASDAGCSAGVRLGWVREHPGNYSFYSYSFPHLCCSVLNSPSDWNFLTHFDLDYLNKMKC